MSRMIDDLLDVSRIIEGKIELRKQVVALETILTAAASLARPGIEARHQELAITLPREPIFLNADATRLDQVFGNLLVNACKYSDSGCHISLSAERVIGNGRQLPEVIVRVRDDGMGIAPELLPRIFDLFVQATSALDRAHGGLGIGLTLVQRLVKMHGGSVEARSEGIGRGSEFIVHLPIFPERSLHHHHHHEPRPLLAKLRAGCSSSMITKIPRAACPRSSGCAATRRAPPLPAPMRSLPPRSFHPEVVLLDIGLPGMDGYEVARHLRAMPALAGAFLVAMTGYGSDEDRAHAKEAGFDEYLVKPVDLDLLRAWLRSRT